MTVVKLVSELWENGVLPSELWLKRVFAVGIMGTFIGIVGTYIFCRNYGKKWEMSRRNYGKISVGIMGRNRRNCGTLPSDAFQLGSNPIPSVSINHGDGINECLRIPRWSQDSSDDDQDQ
jgi:hypothetical protein